MTTTVLELARRPELQLTVIAGKQGLDHEVSWAHISDLPRPWEWLGPHELLLTNGTGLGSSGGAQRSYVEQLEGIGAAGLVIGLGTSRCRITRQLQRSADELALPVLTGPYSLRFADVVRAVARANDVEERHQLGDVARLYDLIRSSLSVGAAAPGLIRALGAELGLTLNLLDPATGRSLIDGESSSDHGPALVRAYDQHDGGIPGLLHLTQHPDSRHVVAVAVPGQQRAALVVESSDAHFPGGFVLQHLAMGAGLELAQQQATRQRRRAIGAEVFGQLLDSRSDPKLGAWQLEESGVVVSACLLGALRSSAVSEDGLHDHLVRGGVAHVLLERAGVVHVLLPEAAAHDWLAPFAAESRSSVGLSADVAFPERVPEAAREARWALGAAEVEGGTVVTYGAAAQPLLPRSTDEAELLVSRVLGDLISYDRDHGTAYLETIRAVVESDRSWSMAASKLNIHRQTLAYRLRKIEQLTGRGTARSADIAAWWIALQAADLLGDTAAHRP